MGYSLLDLLALMQGHFAEGLTVEGVASPEAALVLSLLPDDPALPLAQLAPSSHPVAALVAATHGLDPAWTEVLGSLAPVLPWRFTYAPRADAPGLENRMAWAEIVGPAAPLRNDRVGFGLTFIDRDTYYLPHRHPAVELYNVVTGRALWTLDGVTAPRPPGSFILHPSSAVHAMRTLGDPMLAIYSWSGDIVSPTIYA
ncbi:dimethylsulfonioproprionate lyase family protein [Telmatospirillum sp.]|uniref:dimethylsulfonioproprionate lyase family protein n=1 Tax=Telmatospirillum sp. TaxID=2079197 RepID=UPI0028439FF0|nr:dimethylsulfonioproprionate lyase family protein [Telmatospirillum sp.]MDR3437420.1 dimethylsulfonioproprionate lyase family protein [Telmatospirillum sp.]